MKFKIMSFNIKNYKLITTGKIGLPEIGFGRLIFGQNYKILRI